MTENIKIATQEDYLLDGLVWLIRLRWIAIAGILTTVLITTWILNIKLLVVQIYTIAFVFLIFNTIFLYRINVLKKASSKSIRALNSQAHFQISIDIVCLTALLHFTAGIENPFIFYYIFHVIIASILLERREAFLHITFAVILFLGMSYGECFGLIKHHSLGLVSPFAFYNNKIYVIGISIVFISTLYISAYMASEISKKLRKREQSLRDANRLLKEKDTIKSRYVLKVTHDIKEDLAAIYGCIEPVIAGVMGPLIEPQETMLKRAQRRSKFLIRYVNDLLVVTNMKLTKKLKSKKFSLPQIVTDVSDHILEHANKKNISYEVEIDSGIDEIEGIPESIKQALVNLLMNAIKYTPVGGKILLNVQQKDKSVLIKIKDTGIGIPRNSLPKIFDEFYRVESSKFDDAQGSGLGLAIVKQIAQMHDGDIRVKSEVDIGSTFYLELPFKQEI